MTLISVGHSNKPLEDFVDLLHKGEIDVVYDVRRHPRSRWAHFSRTPLERSLLERGFGYVWIGDLLGGFRDEGYEQWMRTPEFNAGVAALGDAASTRRVAFMCSEGVPWKCHRLFVARALSQRGHEVSHLLPDGSLVPHDPQLALPDL
jgi:uncharacterized protein (DUF488 family)